MTDIFDSDLAEQFDRLQTIPAVRTALAQVKDRLPDFIEIQKELALIEAPSRYEEKKARRYAELLT